MIEYRRLAESRAAVNHKFYSAAEFEICGEICAVSRQYNFSSSKGSGSVDSALYRSVVIGDSVAFGSEVLYRIVAVYSIE